MAKLAFPYRRKTDWRPSLWMLFWFSCCMFLLGELVTSEKSVRMYYPFTITMPVTADATIDTTGNP